MSTDQTQKTATTTAGRADSATESIGKLDLSVTKIIGGALAAMTAAALGAQLSVVGTVIGAAVVSVVAAVAGALYTASIERTGHRVRRVWQRGDAPATIVTVTSEPEPVSDLSQPSQLPARRRLSWPSVLAGALATFGLAAVALTGIELVTGHALSGGEGTTITQVSGGDDRTAPSDSSTPTPEPTPSEEPTSSDTAEATPSESTTPAPTTEATEATETPTPPIPTETAPTPFPTASPTESEAVTPGS